MKELTEINMILRSCESKANVVLDHKQKNAAYSAMLIYAERMIENYRRNENKAINIEAVKLFPSLFRGEFKLWLRKRAFLKGKNMAQRKANIENRKCYLIRSSDIAYTILSTKDVEHNKRVKILGKSVNSMQLTQAADFVAMPKKK